MADQTLRLGRLGGRPGTVDSVCRRVVLDIRGRVRTGVGVGWCFDEARPHARHKRAYESEHLGPGAEPAKHNDSSVRVAFRPVNPVPTRGPAVASPRGSSDWEPSVFETRAASAFISATTQLRHLAVTKNRSVQALLAEAIDLLFKARGLVTRDE